MIPLTVDVPMKRLPWANWGLIVATIVVSLAVPASRTLDVSLPTSQTADLHEIVSKTRIEERLSPLVLQKDHLAAYQLVTSLFQHANPIHLFGNLIFLFVFGNAVNAKLGHLGFLASYLGIGALEGLVWLVVSTSPACLGASAAIMGLCGMFFVLYPLNTVTIFWDEWEIAWLTRSWTAEMPGWGVVLLYFAFDAWGALFDSDANIGYVSHIVGCLLGAGWAALLLRMRWLRADLGEQTLLMWMAGQGPVEKDHLVRRKRKRKVRTEY